MLREFKKVTLIKIKKPNEKEVNKDLQWFSKSIGLFNERDKESSCFRVFVELIKASRKGIPLTSDTLAFKSNLTRATVIHHLKKLIESGLIINENNKYYLRTSNLEELTLEIGKDVLRILEDLKNVAEELDEELGLKKRSRQNSTISD